ncbi:MAG: hypothetical protein Q8M93_16035 [Polaromonas sp.]|uniref:hypothetical protein n=1 Tax=Polaromonas sp. TaxID=1869339 RepID=UPI00272F2B11|nr:hypothetical protein [Polaromonas sp.]MDP2449528.1 hypothetical protein [Polaromonas sp.]MDP3248460.1 hypothetical protein [Polaromonas sp.]
METEPGGLESRATSWAACVFSTSTAHPASNRAGAKAAPYRRVRRLAVIAANAGFSANIEILAMIITFALVAAK